MNLLTRKACDIGTEIVRIWSQWSDATEVESELALSACVNEARTLDMHQIDGVISSPLNYFVRSQLDDENPEDLTWCEMIESIEISVKVLEGRAL
jgi:hypothetical protein